MSLLLALKVAKNKGAEIYGLNWGEQENQTYIGNWYFSEDTSANPMFKANLNLFKALFKKRKLSSCHHFFINRLTIRPTS